MINTVKMVETTKTTVKTSDVNVVLPTKTVDKPVVMVRNIGCETIGKEIVSRITGKLLGFDDLYDPITKQFLTEKELKAKGAVFITVSLNKVLGGSDTTKKSRSTKEPTPYIRKTSKYQVIANINWQSYINKRGSGDFIPAEHRANGVENVDGCKAIGITRAGNQTINGVAFRVLESTKYFDGNGIEYSDIEQLKADYLKLPSKASKQKQADKHGIDVRFDPQYRTTRIDNCDSVRCFGFNYRPTENHSNG